ncbi:Similar to A1CF: APOBEC1 complementation factor (Homo sapiens) [Cotesia congregata]|uniref:Similar to A1CF: APOBEC1 complementation factor (Homo sapiens) n=1 Tax=Cotesia congregata TaxID=51543 RepID=A0A8J2HC66_COTCN|nr:Similar to A1CF: APOBEC1 complementation factor (Homo sapiens) [Cotesia congregata]
MYNNQRSNNESDTGKNNGSLVNKSGKNYQYVYSINNLSNRRWDRSKNDLHDHYYAKNDEKSDLSVEESIEINKNVLEISKTSGLDITQVNGQRKLGPPKDWVGEAPSPECEVFVGNLPRNIYENKLYPIFQRAGEIFEIRLMMDFSGTNRGYCFIKYTKPEYAAKAIKELNEWPIERGKKIGVVASVNNCRLSIARLPPELDTKTFIKKIYETTESVTQVAVYSIAKSNAANKPMQKKALISYKAHIDAAMARRKLMPQRTTLFPNVELIIDWAHPSSSMHNVIEECGVMSEDGEIHISERYIEPKKHYKPKDVSAKSNKFGKGTDVLDKNLGSGRKNTIGCKSKQFFKTPHEQQRVVSNNTFKKIPLNPICKRSLSMIQENNSALRDINVNNKSAVSFNHSPVVIRSPYLSDNKENISDPYLIPAIQNLNQNLNNISLPPVFNFNGFNFNQSYQVVQKNLIMTPNLQPTFPVYQDNFCVDQNWSNFDNNRVNDSYYNQQYCSNINTNINMRCNLPGLNIVRSSIPNQCPENLNVFGNGQGHLINNQVGYRPQYDTKSFGLGKINHFPVMCADNQLFSVPRGIFKSQY